MMPRATGTFDWDGIRLVAFDVDGTLYSQSRLRPRMARDMLVDMVARRSPEAIRVIWAYRQIRERLAERELADFNGVLVADTARVTGRSPGRVRAIVDEWIERRPLRYLAACRYPGVLELFAGLRRNGKTIGIFSDYPAQAKLDALGLRADCIVCAGDRGVGILKPNPRGLEILMASAGVTASETLLIGDRTDRDGAAASRIGVRPLIRSARTGNDRRTFASFDDPVFDRFRQPPLVASAQVAASAPT